MVELRSSIIPSDIGTTRSVVIRDITQEREHRNQLEYLAYYDPLTGLANRKYLQERVDQLIDHNRGCALILADIDHFKEINDTLGHSFGDSLLQAVGNRLKTAFDEDLLVGRAGGDEFILLVPDITTEQMIRNIATAFHAEIARPVTSEGVTIELQCSIGIAYTPIHGLDFNSLLRCADVAMYTAKQTGIEIAIYAPILDRHNPRRLQLLSDISRMIREKSFSLHFQPKVELLNHKIQGYEALSRWWHKQLGAISPAEIIPLAETSNHIEALTEAIIKSTFEQLNNWKLNSFMPTIAINVSARNLTDETFVPYVIDAMNRYDISPNQLEFEITESAFMFDPKRALHSVQKINEIGIHLSVDDFGTGYSSLSYLTDLPVDALKIDLSFVREMIRKEKHQILVSSTIQLGHSLGLSVIAEGIEDKETANTLRQMGCDQGQGFYFGKPVPAGEILR
ncbi:MAG: EAL domain-containing protein [Leptonema sp. (in: Bacteria)]|nr:EAL domain-containing protein [Leptonema sp. (in: bacteria)]